MGVIRSIYERLLTGIKYLLVLLSTVLIVVVFSNVISRYFLHNSLAWADETARFLFIWITFLGAVLAHDRSEHMNLDIVIQSVPRKVGLTLLVIANLIVVGILILITKGGFTVVIENYEWMTPALEISYGMVYSVVPACGVILLLQTLARIVKIIKLFGSSGGLSTQR
ncbi:TRAP transporter small permease [Petroclostridium sp. X23]|uniref:TRAP transporter small permease n=1 Tax=Petroclostridium sp. X23 TaxID=3045146 RepID=UPI0024ACE4EF|nr:TRAP transporter small permease [Petroclostridium sp. X23]WHH61300.1 TRAP transporter small permease [Petroclostridium sp. X23]